MPSTNQRRPTLRPSRVAVLVHCLLLAMVGCAQRGFPKEVVFDADRGRWWVAMDPDATEPPERVPLVTMYKWERVEGLLLVEGTPGYRAVMPRTISPRPESGTILNMPFAVRQSWHGGWTLRRKPWMNTVVKTGDLRDHMGRPIGTSIPLWIDNHCGRIEMTINSGAVGPGCGTGRSWWW